MISARRFSLVLVTLLAMVGCSQSQQSWHGKNITGLMPALEFSLQDAQGPVTASKWKGKIRLVYFGYTHCPDICPTTLATLAHALKKLTPAQADKVRVLFVSVDPKRDSPALLQQYSAAFGPQFVGLTGSEDALHALTKRDRVSFNYGDPDDKGNYEVFHSSAIYAFDGTGNVRLLIRDTDGADAIAADLRRLVEE